MNDDGVWLANVYGCGIYIHQLSEEKTREKNENEQHNLGEFLNNDEVEKRKSYMNTHTILKELGEKKAGKKRIAQLYLSRIRAHSGIR